MIKEPTTNLIIRIPVQLKAQLERCAADADLTASQIVRKLNREKVETEYKGDLFMDVKQKTKKKGT